MSIKKPDLSSVSCTEMIIQGVAVLDEDDLDRILYPGVKDEKRWPILASTQYTVNKKRMHTCLILFPGVAEVKKGKVRLVFRISVEPGRFTVLPEARKELDSFKIIRQLVKTELKVDLYLVAHFAYPTRRFETMISLPYDITVPPFEKAEVMGLRINVKRPPNEDYSQIVDLMREGKISHSISFRKRAHALNESFMTDLLAEASTYSKRLIRKRGKGGT